MEITLKDVKDFLKSNDEGKAYLADIIESEVSGLKKKNTQLIEKLKKEETEREAAETELEEVKETLTKGKPDFEKEKKKLEDKFNKDKKELEDKLAEATGHINKLVIETGISDALNEAKIAPVHSKTVAAFIKSSNKIDLDTSGDTPKAKVGDKPLAEFIKSWAESEEGKHYVAAPDNNGGGAKGGGDKAGNIDLMKLNPVERLNHARSQGKK